MTMSAATNLITSVEAYVMNVSAKTNWVFVAVGDSSGRIGWGEASINGWEPLLLAATKHMSPDWLGMSLQHAAVNLRVSSRLPGGLIANAVISSVAQGVASLMVMQEQTTPSELIGSRLRDRIKVYANINRATQDRTPAGFVKTALRARDQGFSAFKAAPFDGLTPSSCTSLEGKKKIHHGIEVISALRDALGSEVLLMVDCHWRFDEAGAMYALKELQSAKLHWYECPIAETHAHWPATRRIRAAANAQGVLLAAAESQVGIDDFKTLFDEALYDVVMPDIKYCGGPWEMLRIAQLAAQNGVQFSPHNPSGPVCTWHSLQVAAAAPSCSMLEIQFDESHLYDEIQTEPALLLQNGELTVSNRLGFAPGLQLAVLEKHPYQAVPPGAETLLNR
jgi:galactonate dehydratase